jgi:hypothetical protein
VACDVPERSLRLVQTQRRRFAITTLLGTIYSVGVAPPLLESKNLVESRQPGWLVGEEPPNSWIPQTYWWRARKL